MGDNNIVNCQEFERKLKESRLGSNRAWVG